MGLKDSREVFEETHKIKLSERDRIIFDTAYGFGVMDATNGWSKMTGEDGAPDNNPPHDPEGWEAALNKEEPSNGGV